MQLREECLPFRSAADAIFDDLCFVYRSGVGFEKRLELISTEPVGQLLDKDGATISLVLVWRGARATISGPAMVIGATFRAVTAVTTIVAVSMISSTVAVITRIMAAGRAGTRAGTSPSAAIEVSVSALMMAVVTSAVAASKSPDTAAVATRVATAGIFSMAAVTAVTVVVASTARAKAAIILVAIEAARRRLFLLLRLLFVGLLLGGFEQCLDV